MPALAHYYSKAELARHFQIPESTIRFYCSRFADFLPSKGEGRAMRYTPTCLDVLACIMENLPQARTSAVMEDVLAQRFTRHARRAKKSPPAAYAAKGWPTATIPDRFDQCSLPEQETPLADQLISVHTSLATLQRETEALREEVQRLRILLDTSEKTHQADLDQLRAWLGRLTREQIASHAD